MTLSEAVTFQFFAGVANSLNRIIVGYISDLSPFSKYRCVLTSFFEVMVSLSLLMATFYSDFTSLALISVIGGASTGATLSQLPTTIYDIVPVEFMEGLSVVRMMESIGALIALFLTGKTTI